MRTRSPRFVVNQIDTLAGSAALLDEAELPRLLERVGPRRDTELSIDRTCVAVNRVVREVELATDVALGQPAGEHSQDHELALAERCIAVLPPRPRRSFQRSETLGEHAGIRARIDDRSRFRDHAGRSVVTVEGAKHRCLPDQRVGDSARVAGRTKDSDVTLYKSLGSIVQDLAAARHIVAKLVATG